MFLQLIVMVLVSAAVGQDPFPRQCMLEDVYNAFRCPKLGGSANVNSYSCLSSRQSYSTVGCPYGNTLIGDKKKIQNKVVTESSQSCTYICDIKKPGRIGPVFVAIECGPPTAPTPPPCSDQAFTQMDKFHNNYIPVLKSGPGCPISYWLNHLDVPPMPTDCQSNSNQCCQIGDRYVKIGRIFRIPQSNNNKYNVMCSCNCPPMPTCVIQ